MLDRRKLQLLIIVVIVEVALKTAVFLGVKWIYLLLLLVQILLRELLIRREDLQIDLFLGAAGSH